MESILQVLHDMAQSKKMSQATSKSLEQLLIYEDKIQEAFGYEFVLELEKAWDDLHLATLDEAYESGFLTAFQLWVEVACVQKQRI